jgi:hypothetical protein
VQAVRAIKGVVRDFGGGEFIVLVDRDTMNYPDKGARVFCIVDEHEEEPEPEACSHCAYLGDDDTPLRCIRPAGHTGWHRMPLGIVTCKEGHVRDSKAPVCERCAGR